MKVYLKNGIYQLIGYVNPVFGIAALLSLFLRFGFHLSASRTDQLFLLDQSIAAYFILTFLTELMISTRKRQFLRQSPLESALLLLFVITLLLDVFLFKEPAYEDRSRLYQLAIHLYNLANAIVVVAENRKKWLYFSLNPARIILLSYLILILSGSLLLMLPRATFSGISFTDAFFMASSSVCVTGLTSLNVSQAFTFEGQVIILLLIQLGGLGIITLTTFIALFIHRGLRLRDQVIVSEILDSGNFSSLNAIIKAIVAFTFVAELAGAAGLYLSWSNLGLSGSERVFSAIFHSVSAFCNAGFSIFPEGFETAGYQFSNLSQLIIMTLIISGGLGFLTFSDVFHIGDLPMIRRKGLTLQSRIILWATLMLVLAGAILIWLLQDSSWKNLGFGDRAMRALFLSITSRTAGFSTVPISDLAIPTLLFVMLLMYIGGAPNSTAGGIKLTTAATLLASLRAFAAGKNQVELGWNTIPARIVRRAFMVLIISSLLVFTAVFILTITEDQPFLDLLFETVSAFATVGLSRGITAELSIAGKYMIVLVMYIGRIGLFTFAIAISEERDEGAYRFPDVNLMVG